MKQSVRERDQNVWRWAWEGRGSACRRGQGGKQSELDIPLPIFLATTSEGKLAKLGHKIGKDLDQTVKGILNYLGNLVPDAGVMKL